jgi:hypothetical protein
MRTDQEAKQVFPSAIPRAYDLLLAGVGLGSIAGTWNAAGLPAGPDGSPAPTGRRGTWTADGVRAVLAQPGYAGRLVDEPTWRSAAALLSGPLRHRTAGSDPALLTAIACCGPCGRPVGSAVVAAGQVAYRCGGDRIHLARTCAPIDARVRLDVLDRLSRPDAPELMADHRLAVPVDRAWDTLAVSRRRGVLLALTERIELHPIPPGRPAGDPDVLRETVLITWRTS